MAELLDVPAAVQPSAAATKTVMVVACVVPALTMVAVRVAVPEPAAVAVTEPSMTEVVPLRRSTSAGMTSATGPLCADANE